MAEQKTVLDFVSDIWKVADYVRDVIKRSEYNRVVLPFALLRRLECALEPTRDAVLKGLAEHESEWGREHDGYRSYSKKAFYNTTNFRLNNLGASDTLDSLNEYINGFSENARNILLRFKMEETCKTLQEHGMLYTVCQKFSAFDLSPETVSDREMSNIYEHLIERFGEEIAEDAEDFMTPKDVVRLAVNMVFANDIELLNADDGTIRSLYDPTCGTGGFISDALDVLDEWHAQKTLTVPTRIVAYGQEIEAESWAMGKANILLRNTTGEGLDSVDQITDPSSHIMYGDTLSDDKFEGQTFDYQLSNPPYGKKWEKEKDAVEDEAKLGFRGRFGAGLPSIDDGSMLFMQHVVNKMKPAYEGGGKAGIVLSGSPLFTGDPGSGPSGIRRWLFQQDVVDCIVKLPTDIFFRTGIATYLWIFNNVKPDWRKGKIQLIDASDCKIPLRKSLGNKRFEIPQEKIQWIVKTYVDGHNGGKSVLVPVEDFMFRKVTTQRPLRMKLRFDEEKKAEFFAQKSIQKLGEANLKVLAKFLDSDILPVMDANSGEDMTIPVWGQELPYGYAAELAKNCRKSMDKPKATPADIEKAIIAVFGVKNESYPIVKDENGNPLPDPELKDFENIPFTEDFDSYMQREVLPFAPDTWIDETVRDVPGAKIPLGDRGVGVVGTNISFNKYFYHYEMPREPQVIADEIRELERGLESFLEGVL